MPLVKRHGETNIISCSKLLSVWKAVVGEDISKKAQPVRIKTIEGGNKNILFLGMNGPYMAELSLQIRDIIEKINAYYSQELIAQIKLQRVHYVTNKNVVEFENAQFLDPMKNEELNASKADVLQLENALEKMKYNLSNSRKDNEIK